jgi:hypothetical protein
VRRQEGKVIVLEDAECLATVYTQVILQARNKLVVVSTFTTETFIRFIHTQKLSICITVHGLHINI